MSADDGVGRMEHENHVVRGIRVDRVRPPSEEPPEERRRFGILAVRKPYTRVAEDKRGLRGVVHYGDPERFGHLVERDGTRSARIEASSHFERRYSIKAILAHPRCPRFSHRERLLARCSPFGPDVGGEAGRSARPCASGCAGAGLGEDDTCR